jgi:tetratricopeptide (TPR) repeat protein
MRTTLLTVGLVGIVLANVVRADLEVGSYAPDVEAKEWLDAEKTLTEEEIPSLKELRGMVVVLFFWVSFHSGGESIMPFINIVATNPRFGRRQGITVIGLTEATRKAVEPAIKREKLFFPIGVESKAAEDYEIESFPRLVIVDPDGKVAWSGGPGNLSDVVRTIFEVIEKTPPRMTHPEDAELCREDLATARAAIRKGKWHEAFIAARSAFERAVTGDPLKTICLDTLDLIEALGRNRMGPVAQLLDDKKYQEAVDILRQVRRTFRGLDVSRKAKERLTALEERYEEVADILKVRQDERKAAELYLEARQSVEKRRFGPAYVQLESVLKDYDETDAAEFAERMLDRMQENPAVMVHVRDYKAARDCQSWLSQGRAYKSAGRGDKARELFQRVVDEYPDTGWAQQAERELINLR